MTVPGSRAEPATGLARPRRTARLALARHALVPALCGLLVAFGALFAVDRWIAATPMPPVTPPTSVEVLARDGRLLRAFTVDDGRWRLAASPDEVDRRYVDLLLSYEDRRFYRHGGVDPLALARAVVQSVTGGRLVSGGSTLTMQVARLLADGATGSWGGKLRQVRLALALERTLSKDEILALYMNLAPMGGNLEGVRAGSLAWFGKEPSRLTEAEAALLVALPQAPAGRSPDVHPQAARAARDRVLARGVVTGVITEEAAMAAGREVLPSARRSFPALAPHLADRLAMAEPSALVHVTTIDSDVQRALETLAASALVDLPPQVTVALLVADVHSGEVLASVGSGDYTSEARRGYVDMTQALRSPGSTLKPLIYGLAFSSGILHPESLLYDRPEDYGGYAPQNFDGTFRGRVTARQALELSLNLPVVAVTEALGPARLLAALRQAGVQAVVQGDTPGLAVALGGVGISLTGLVQLYASLANGGQVVELTTVLPGGDGSAQAAAVSRPRLLSAVASWQVAQILAGAPRPAGSPAWQVAFKTGTSSGNRDALALAFDGAHVIGVWVGRADGTPVPGMFGVEVAAPLLFEAFARLGGPVALRPPPPGLPAATATAELPEHLRQFGARTLAVDDSPRLTFPPDGAALEALAGGIPARVERGQPPFTWFANGAPVAVGSFEREARLALEGPGFVTLSVIDARGRAARVDVELR